MTSQRMPSCGFTLFTEQFPVFYALIGASKNEYRLQKRTEGRPVQAQLRKADKENAKLSAMIEQLKK